MNIVQLYHDWILWIGDGTGLLDTILHVHAGLAILLLVRVVTGRSLATIRTGEQPVKEGSEVASAPNDCSAA